MRGHNRDYTQKLTPPLNLQFKEQPDRPWSPQRCYMTHRDTRAAHSAWGGDRRAWRAWRGVKNTPARETPTSGHDKWGPKSPQAHAAERDSPRWAYDEF